MAVIKYPDNIPQEVLIEGNTGKAKPSIIQSNLDSGISKRRLSGTFIPMEFTITVGMTPAEFGIFENWRNTYEKYVNPFEWKNPYTKKIGMFRILGGHTYKDIGGANYEVSFTMESIPQ